MNRRNFFGKIVVGALLTVGLRFINPKIVAKEPETKDMFVALWNSVDLKNPRLTAYRWEELLKPAIWNPTLGGTKRGVYIKQPMQAENFGPQDILLTIP
jgi:hypothetical protein